MKISTRLHFSVNTFYFFLSPLLSLFLVFPFLSLLSSFSFLFFFYLPGRMYTDIKLSIRELLGSFLLVCAKSFFLFSFFFLTTTYSLLHSPKRCETARIYKSLKRVIERFCRNKDRRNQSFRNIWLSIKKVYLRIFE